MEARGTLSSWNDEKGFGFIRPQAGGEQVFVHISVLRGARRPVSGDRVLYHAARDPQGRWRASHVRLDAPICLDDPAIRERPKASQAPAAGASRSLFARQWQAPWLKLGLFMLLCAAPMGGSLLLLQQQGLAWPLLAYAVASVLALLLYGQDKRSALRGARRTPENSLHLVEALGGWPGALLAQQLFRHKTRKLAYQLPFWGIVLLHQLFWIDRLLLGQTLLQALRTLPLPG